MLRTQRMEKISITGPETNLDTTVKELYSLGLLDIEDYDGQYDSFEVGSPTGQADAISALLVKLRSVMSKLPSVDEDEIEREPVDILEIPDVDDRIEDIDDEIDEYLDDMDDLEDQRDQLEQLAHRLKALRSIGVSLDDIREYDSLDIYFGTIEDTAFTDDLVDGHYELNQDGDTILLFINSDIDVEDRLDASGFEPYDLEELYGREGRPVQALNDVRNRLAEIDSEIESDRQHLRELSAESLHALQVHEEEFQEELEKAEAPLRFATSDNAFIAEGWIPAERVDEVADRLAEATGGSVHLEREDAAGETPPVEHANPAGVTNFEDLTDLVSLPKYHEVDPTFMLFLTFPLFFGFMIGDAGYGVTSFIVFYLGMKAFPQGKEIFKSLMFASVATFLFGLAFGDVFGFTYEELAHLTGITALEGIPVLFHRAHHLNQVFQVSVLIGAVHINIGYLIGMYNEYVAHDLKEAILARGSWLVLEIGALAWIFYGTMVGAPVVGLAVAMLAFGEGIEGVVEIPSLLSNILSYLRIFGVSVAAVALAAVVNALANPLLTMGTAWGIVLGVVVLMVGHIFNTFIKIMEGFLQGIRLHYVEMFTKFFEGGGKRYTPFGKRNDM